MQRDGIRQVVAVFDEIENECLSRRCLEAVYHPVHERQRDHVPRPDDAGEREDREGEGHETGRALGKQQQAAAVDALGEYSRDRRQKEQRNLLCERGEAEHQCGAGEAVDEPALRYDLQPEATSRDIS